MAWSSLFLHPSPELSKKVIEERKVKQYHGQPGTTNPTTKNGLRVGKKKKQRLRIVKYGG
ncbi:hypothetical protein NC653_040306 [Populus alba x Populus x berolinensis]|uniref:Uncharacterized protein n=1 Tax=Populus alba x Populus x berolinensis TaxID=444605 RepID=A0AAD6LDL3_9ROSI|nr:hypothetical protein NC653_040306 [Populus alba x Populus x berolinensis]